MSETAPPSPVMPATAANGGPPTDPDGFAYLQRLLLEEAGVLLDPDKQYLAEARLHGLAREEGCGSVSGLLDVLQTEETAGALHRRTVEAMLNGETSFFRDFHPFEALRTVVLPELMARRRDTRILHVWSAATGSGQEAYSLAMLLHEMAPTLRDWHVRILATDISESMLDRARMGAYRQIEVNRGLPATYLVKYFRRNGGEWRVKDSLREMVEFSHLNLAKPWPPLPPADVLLLRNALLYFSSEARRTILENVGRTLRPDGYLFLGGGETVLALDPTYEAVRVGKAVCFRRKAPTGARGDRGEVMR